MNRHIYARFSSHEECEECVEEVVTAIPSDRIIVVYKGLKENRIHSLFMHIGWRSQIQAVITLTSLYNGIKKHAQANILALLLETIISTMATEITMEFPSVRNDDFQTLQRAERLS